MMNLGEKLNEDEIECLIDDVDIDGDGQGLSTDSSTFNKSCCGGMRGLSLMQLCKRLITPCTTGRAPTEFYRGN